MSLNLPSNFLGLDDINVDVTIMQIPKINIGIDPIHIGLDPINITLQPLEIKPLDMSFRLKELPAMRVWMPMDYKVCLALFGAELASVRLCGQGQVITEPYVANPCECRPRRQGLAAVARADADADAVAVPG